MQKTFYIRLRKTPETGVEWLTRGERGIETAGSGELREAALRAQGAKIVVLAPATSMITVEAELPSLPATRLRQALPYALEEQFAEEVDTLHFAIGKRQPAGFYPVVALERSQMEQWQRLFSEAELRPHVMLNEALVLPWEEGQWSLLLQDDEALLRTEQDRGYAIPMVELEEWLALAWQEQAEPPTLLRLFDGRSSSEPEPWHGRPVGAEVQEEKLDSPISLLAKADPAQGINLLQGDFSRKERLGRLWRPWRATAALLGVWLILQGGLAVGRYVTLSAEEKRLDSAIEKVYRETFPEARNVVNPQVQMERKLAELKNGGSVSAFVVLLAASGPVLNGIDGLQLRNIRYKQDELELEVELKDLPSLDRLKAALQQKQLMVDIRGASTRDGKVESRIALKEAGA